jgi:two-component system NarL family sensor kinase
VYFSSNDHGFMAEMILYLSLALLLLGAMVLFFFVVYRIRLNRSIKERKELELKNIQALLQTKIEIREQTLKDVSLEIHDNIAQVLSLAKLHLSSAQAVDTNQVNPRVSSAKDLLTHAIQDLRDLSKQLTAEQSAHFDLVKSSELLVEQVRKAGAHEVTFSVSGQPVELPYPKGIILYRIIQELLQNTLKHAGAAGIDVAVDFDDTSIRLLIADNGKGFNVNQEFEGIGLKNIRERAALLGASVEISSLPQKGTKTLVVLPLNEVK